MGSAFELKQSTMNNRDNSTHIIYNTFFCHNFKNKCNFTLKMHHTQNRNKQMHRHRHTYGKPVEEFRIREKGEGGGLKSSFEVSYYEKEGGGRKVGVYNLY